MQPGLAPDANGGSLNQYLYEICKGVGCSIGGPSGTVWNQKRYMCADGNTRVSKRLCSYGGTPYGGFQPMAPAGENFAVTIVTGADGSGDPLSAQLTEYLEPLTTYSMVVRARTLGTGTGLYNNNANIPGAGSQKDKVESVFSVYDADGNGFIEYPELQSYLTSVFTVLYATQAGTQGRLGVPPTPIARQPTFAGIVERDDFLVFLVLGVLGVRGFDDLLHHEY